MNRNLSVVILLSFTLTTCGSGLDKAPQAVERPKFIGSMPVKAVDNSASARSNDPIDVYILINDIYSIN